MMSDGEDLAQSSDHDLIGSGESAIAGGEAMKCLDMRSGDRADQRVSKVTFTDSAETEKAGRIMSGASDDTAQPMRAIRGRVLRNMDAGIEAAERLGRAIDNDILPALLKFHGGPAAFEGGELDLAELESTAVDYFISVLLRQDYAGTVSYLEELRRRPVPLSVLFSDLLTPAAQRLGEMWSDDECSFVDVTVGVSHLQRLVRDFAPLYAADVVPSAGSGRLLLAATSGEQHTFALTLIGELFRRAGWLVYEAPQHSDDELVELLGLHHFDIVGFSLSFDGLTDALENDITRVREASFGRDTKIIVGGPAFSLNPDLLVGKLADAVLFDAEAALQFASEIAAKNSKSAS